MLSNGSRRTTEPCRATNGAILVPIGLSSHCHRRRYLRHVRRSGEYPPSRPETPRARTAVSVGGLWAFLIRAWL
jgi:hypothetical protein